MPHVDLLTSLDVPLSTRVQQLGGMFDVPIAEKCERRWSGSVPIEEREWNVGLIVGPSGAGKSQVARQLFPGLVDVPLEWTDRAVIDDFRDGIGIEAISNACSAVGFNTIPSWMRPFATLSNGEQFRVALARRLVELPDPIVVDEFTSVVDRQVGQIGAHAVQKWARRNGRQFVAVTCHHDVIDWLDPDWILEPATMAFQWRSLRQRRPRIDVTISPVGYAAWASFALFHYMSASLNKAARCFGLWCNGTLAAFAGILPFPHKTRKDIRRVSRVVTLPDWQGLGLAFTLLDTLGAAYRALGMTFRNYPAHPAFIRAHDRSPAWALVKKPGTFSPRTGSNSALTHTENQGGRANAVFEFAGPPMNKADAERLIEGTIHPAREAVPEP